MQRLPFTFDTNPKLNIARPYLKKNWQCSKNKSVKKYESMRGNQIIRSNSQFLFFYCLVDLMSL
jgi:hypothetical protein